jgi:hypothetical protein
MSLSIGSMLVAVAAFGYAAYEMWSGYQYYKLSGFRFFLIGGIWTGIPFVLVAAILVFLPNRNFGGWELGILAAWLAVFPWKFWQERKARRQEPERWARWIKKLEQSRRRRSFF